MVDALVNSSLNSGLVVGLSGTAARIKLTISVCADPTKFVAVR